jgi:octaprenyl-diphosphate synthase
MPVLRIVADATNVIAEGEVLQLMNTGNAGIDEDAYLTVIHHKTAKLFEAAARLGAVLGSDDEARIDALARYGLHVGTAFQIMDDVLDYSGEVASIGKNLGDDLAEGKPTLPLIHALQKGNAEQRELIRLAIEQGGLAELARITEAVEATGGLEYTQRLARTESRAAIAALDGITDSGHAQALRALAVFTVERSH